MIQLDDGHMGHPQMLSGHSPSMPADKLTRKLCINGFVLPDSIIAAFPAHHDGKRYFNPGAPQARGPGSAGEHGAEGRWRSWR